MPFGLCNAPSTFQRLMERLFGDQRCQSLLLYLDDVVVFFCSSALGEIGDSLGSSGEGRTQGKVGEMCFLQDELKYLGHVISAQGVATDPGYYRRFVEGFAKLAAPLHRLVAEVIGGKSATAKLGATEQRWVAELAAFDSEEADPVIGQVIKFWERGQQRPGSEECWQLNKPVLTLLQQWNRLKAKEGVLHQRIFRPDGGEECYQLVLPDVLREEVLIQLHQHHGHQGVERTSELIRQRCYWPNMLADITRWCQECERCQLAKDNWPTARAFMGHLLASRPNEVLAIDFTVLEPSFSGQENVLVMTDVFSKFSMAVPTGVQRAETVVQVLVEEWFYKFGVPGRIHSDQGSNFESDLIRQLCELYQVRKSRSTPYHPAGNGQCERFNRTLYNLLRTLPGSRKRDWASCLSQVVFCYNTTPHQLTGESPYYLMFGQEPQLPVDFLLGGVPEPAAGSIQSWVMEHRR
ncbi:uncharacterized protein LOC122335106, partial [Tachysurus ichikawai]